MPIFPNDIIVNVLQGGPQGPSGPPIETNDFVSLSSSTGYFYQIKNEQKYKILIPTGLECININYNEILDTNICPLIYSNISINNDIMYSCCIKDPTQTGCLVCFSDIIKETGIYLHVLVKNNVNLT